MAVPKLSVWWVSEKILIPQKLAGVKWDDPYKPSNWWFPSFGNPLPVHSQPPDSVIPYLSQQGNINQKKKHTYRSSKKQFKTCQDLPETPGRHFLPTPRAACRLLASGLRQAFQAKTARAMGFLCPAPKASMGARFILGGSPLSGCPPGLRGESGHFWRGTPL